MLHGLECWNRPDKGLWEEWQRVKLMQSNCLKIRAYHPPEVVTGALTINPNMWILLRRSDDGRIDAQKQLAEVGPLLYTMQNRRANVIYILDNEPNHPDSPYRTLGINQYQADLMELVAIFYQSYPWLDLCGPPMAVQNGDLAWMSVIEPTLQRMKVPWRACHTYWQGQNWMSEDWGERLVQYRLVVSAPRGWIVDEVGDTTPDKSKHDKGVATAYVMDWLRSTGVVHAATVFIAGGTSEWQPMVLDNDDYQEMGRILHEDPPPLPTAPDLPPGPPTFKLGFKDYAADFLSWRPIEQERPDWEGNAYQRFYDEGLRQEGMLYWNKAENWITHYWRE